MSGDSEALAPVSAGMTEREAAAAIMEVAATLNALADSLERKPGARGLRPRPALRVLEGGGES